MLTGFFFFGVFKVSDPRQGLRNIAGEFRRSLRTVILPHDLQPHESEWSGASGRAESLAIRHIAWVAVVPQRATFSRCVTRPSQLPRRGVARRCLLLRTTRLR